MKHVQGCRYEGSAQPCENPACREPLPPLRVGDVLQGFCDGIFGRDFVAAHVRVEAIGADWIVCRDDGGWPWAATVDYRGEGGWKIDDLVKHRRQR